jgi:hypothetical protein
MVTSRAVSPPTEWVGSGHHSPSRAVNSSNARATGTSTWTVLVSVAWVAVSAMPTSVVSSDLP